MKRHTLALLTVLSGLLLSLLLTGVAGAAAREVAVEVNGMGLSTEVPPMIVEKRTMVPMRSLCESLGIDVAWNAVGKTVIAAKSGSVVTLPVGSRTAFKDGRPISLDVPAMVVDGRTLVPARFVAEAFGARVSWSQATATVKIAYIERRDGKSAREVLDAAAARIAQLATYRFSGTQHMTSSATPNIFGTDDTDMDTEIEGAVRAPQEVYAKTTLLDEEGVMLESNEVYVNGADYYLRYDGLDWEKLEVPAVGSFFDEGLAGSPATVFSQIAGIPTTAAFGDDALVDGRPHYTIYAKLDSDAYREYMLDMLLGFGDTEDELGLYLRELFREILKNMRFDLAYKVFVDKETLIADAIETRDIFKLTLEGAGTTTTGTEALLRVYDFDAPVEMPDPKENIENRK